MPLGFASSVPDKIWVAHPSRLRFLRRVGKGGSLSQFLAMRFASLRAGLRQSGRNSISRLTARINSCPDTCFACGYVGATDDDRIRSKLSRIRHISVHWRKIQRESVSEELPDAAWRGRMVGILPLRLSPFGPSSSVRMTGAIVIGHKFAIDSLQEIRYSLPAPQGVRSRGCSLTIQKCCRLPPFYGISTELGKWVIW